MNKTLTINKKSWDEASPRFYGRNPLPEYGPLAPTEDELQLLGNIGGKKVLDIGCGSGHSLQYMKNNHASELWGLDLSHSQLQAAAQLLIKDEARLFEAPMEENPGIPRDYFDIVYSIYALGWTTDLDQTLANIHSYLKAGGIFVFSWEHPFYNRVQQAGDSLILNQSYHQEGAYAHEAWSQPAIMQQFKVSTYLNTLINNGFMIEQVIEEVRLSEEDVEKHSNRWYSFDKASHVPTTLIVKARKE
ncbi:class I SAM-dependent methyltransferase [Rossellomorea aquimaris]|uniref:class I SAM-dependent methyltransferase n=1 Tax=Rossellomorea aquimaris TaxID=189382 RepID=UPI001CD52BD4|nr:class I SAM-dependent methyltransferase [Rossellomorea aquimaris]MCA1058836.1 class I SAM-dependent methyltransferase [Rossellomorea aquimaris]